MIDECVAIPEMRKFFEKLLTIKENIRMHAKNNDDLFLYEIYQQLDDIIKESNT